MHQADTHFFLQIIRHGSISAAARSLGMSPPALSKRLAQLEQRLGVQLIQRTTRRMNPTHEGQLYYEQASRLFAEFNALEQEIMTRGTELVGVLRINAPLNFGRMRVAPVVEKFSRAHPRLEVDLILSDHPHDLIKGRFDVGIRFGNIPDSRLRARRLASNRRYLWAAPAYLEEHGVPVCPRDLMLHQCIIVPRNDDTYGVWTFSRNDVEESIKVDGSLRCNDSEVAMAWALEGRGILMRSAWDTERHARNRKLKKVLADYQLPNRDVFVVYGGNVVSAKVRCFVEFALQAFSEPDA